MPALKKTKPHAPIAPDLASNPEVLEVNLVRDEVEVEFNWGRHIGSLFLILILVAGLVTEIYFGLDWWQGQERTQTEKLKAEHAATTQQINNINNNSQDFIDFKDKVSLVEKLIDQHIYWSDFFTWLEQNTLNSVRYVDFTGDIDGEYVLAAQTKNYRDVSWQAKAFKDNPWVDEISVRSASLQEEEIKDTNLKEEWIDFSIELKIKPEIFYRLRSQIEEVDNSNSSSTPVEVDSSSAATSSLPIGEPDIIQVDFLPTPNSGELLSPEIINTSTSNLPPLINSDEAPVVITEEPASSTPEVTTTESGVVVNFE